MPKNQQLFSTEGAATYLGCTKHNIIYHRLRGNLAAEFVGNALVFHRAELDRFRGEHMTDGITKKEISEKYGVSPSLVQYYMTSGRISPVGKNKQSWVFCADDAEKVFGPA